MRRSLLRPLIVCCWGSLTLFAGGPALTASKAEAASGVESTKVSVCRLIESSAKVENLPVVFLTRLIWQESSFRRDAMSPAGAEGIAQFMPGTAGERGLADPFDPEQAIPKAAELLGDLKQRFGNLGLAAAAYNAGSGRVSDWLAGRSRLPNETRGYVLTITQHPIEDWTGEAQSRTSNEWPPPGSSCLQAIAGIRRTQPDEIAGSALVAPWGVQFSGSHSKSAALAAYARAQHAYPAILGDLEPMILAGRAAGFGFQTYYQIRAPAATRAAANALCDKVRRAGGACAVLRN